MQICMYMNTIKFSFRNMFVEVQLMFVEKISFDRPRRLIFASK